MPDMRTRPRFPSALTDQILMRQNSLQYWSLFERFHQRPLLNANFEIPALTDSPASQDALRDDLEAADTLPRMRTWPLANRNWELSGTNADDAGVERLTGGGIRLETAGADGDEHIIGPHSDTGQSALGSISFVPELSPLFMARIKTGPDAADITSAIIWMGWKLTGVEVVATDDNQAYWRFEDDVNSGAWQCITSDDGADETTSTTKTVEAATFYDLAVMIDPRTRQPGFYLNNELIATGQAIDAGTALKPFIGVAGDGAAEAKELDILCAFVSQMYA